MSETDVTNASAGEIALDTIVTGGAVGYLRGTRLLTRNGETPIEDLVFGDVVVTCFSGLQTVQSISRQSFAAADFDHAPVRFHPGSLGKGMPARDLYVAPGHSLLLGNSLILARTLINGITITQDEYAARVEYFQLDLGRHDCVVAGYAWSETGPNAATPCAPRVEHGMPLYAAVRPVVARAAAGLTPGMLRGFVDVVDAEWIVHGWAQDLDYPELPVTLDIILDGRVIGTVVACDRREDLRQAGIGPCSFLFLSPLRLPPELWPMLQVRRASDGATLDVSPSIHDSATPGLRLVA